MKLVELYGKVRYAVQIAGISRREAARRFGIDPRTVAKMLSFAVPPGYRRRQPPKRPKLDPFTGIIDQILDEDQGRLGFPPGSGGFANEPEHPRRRIWQKDEADVGSRRNLRRRRSSGCWMAVRGCRRWPPNSG